MCNPLKTEFKDKAVYFESSKQQLVKDLKMVDIAWKATTRLDNFEELFEFLKPMIAQLLHESPKKMFELLYRIDIPEDVFQTAINASKPVDFLSMTILKRMVQKVCLRQLHSENINTNKNMIKS